MEKSQAENRIREFCLAAPEMIIEEGEPWSRLAIMRPNDYAPGERERVISEILKDERISGLVGRLEDPKLGIPSIASKPADFRVYGSYFWILRFFADMGMTSDILSIESLLSQLALYQLPNGQFTADYRRPGKIPVASICLTANLLQSLAVLQPHHKPSIRAAVNYLLTTQRPDGGWHCDLARQAGEKLEQANSCPAANLAIIGALSRITQRPRINLAPAIGQIGQFCRSSAWSDYPSCDFSAGQFYTKLRYPQHYHGFDLLNVVSTISFYRYRNCQIFSDHVAQLIAKWDGKGFLRSEKTIPEWKAFSFAKRGSRSCWLTAMTLKTMRRLMGRHS
ncbi:MAG: hypothetical protein V2J62_05125 [candidate division KSB1 bacterium]|jgi:hypothetical protein|nr:hypothetical protein [candidate division KSB1 bacterium]